MAKHPSRPRDANQLAKRIVDLSVGDAVDVDPDAGKNRAAVILGRMGGLKGGTETAKRLSPEQKTVIAKKAAAARWKK